MKSTRSAVEDLKTIKQIDRILHIWKEREIFGKDFIEKLQSFRPKGLRSDSQSEDQTDGTLLSPTKKRVRSTSDSGTLSICSHDYSFPHTPKRLFN